MYIVKPSLNELKHYGIEGQKWGVRNGPPYPLNSEGQMKAIQAFNSELNKWSYGVLINGKVETDPNKIDWSKYKTIPIKEGMAKKVGICWDFVNYQHDRFKKNGFHDEAHLFVGHVSDDPNDIVTHSFSTVDIDDKKYWFESSWFKHQGVHEVESYKDVVDVLSKEYGEGNPYEVYQYNPDGMDKNLSNGEFFHRSTKNLVYKNGEYIKHSADPIEEGTLMHYGMPRRSGRYPWGSGENPYQHSGDFLSRVNELKKAGRSDTEIAESMEMSTTQYRTMKAIAKNERRSLEADTARSLRDRGYSLQEIAQKMGYKNDSSIRSLLNERSYERMTKAKNTAEFLKEKIDEKGMIDVGAGVERELNISKEKLNQALYILESQGYPTYGGRISQVTNGDKKTTIKVVCPPGTEHKEIFNTENIHSLRDYSSHDGGETFDKFEYPKSMDSSRLSIRYAEEGGKEKDGLVELRRGVDDLSLGESHYAQVRILVDGTHYIKGMAVYSDDMPDGVDVVFNTNKKKGTPREKVLKEIKNDPDNPFGSYIGPNGQSYYTDKNGERQLSLINKRADEGDWGSWSDHLPAQFLSKQPTPLIQKQLNLTISDKEAEFDTICAYTNPTVKKVLLKSFAEDCDSAAEHLQAAALPRQKYHVILPLTSIKDDEIYAPNYRDGEKIAAIRYPHGGTFEIPVLTVNNKQPEGRKVIGTDSKDAVGINSNVAARLSGADYDGDTVMTIPCNSSRSKVQITSTSPLEGLEGFEAKDEYGYDNKVEDSEGNVHYFRNGREFKPMKNTQTEMGIVSNLITDMTLKGATEDELAAAVRHSMVVIDAEKHGLDYRQSEKDNNIALLKKKYQGTVDENGVYHEGAATLISRAKSQTSVPKRTGQPWINPETGALEWERTNPKTGEFETKITPKVYTTKDGKTHVATQKSTKMAETSDARTLSSGTPQEELYADYANSIKSLANRARKEMISTGKIEYNRAVAEIYKPEVAQLKADLNIALKNAPRERQAQMIANATVAAKKADNPGMTREELKKAQQQALSRARNQVGAKRTSIPITDRQWEAIQAGAISENQLTQILNHTDTDRIKELAMPRDNASLSQAQQNKIKAMQLSGYTTSQIADAVGCSTSTVRNYL